MVPHDPEDTRAEIEDIVEETAPEVSDVGPAMIGQKTALAIAVACFFLGYFSHC